MANWVKVTQASAVPEGGMCGADVGDARICVSKVNGKYYAINDLCTHAEGYLSDGELTGTVVECPLHGAQFDVCSGAVKQMPASEPVRTYPVKVEGDALFVDVGE